MPLRIDYRPIDSLLPYTQNARRHPEEQLSRLATSIREHGFCVPVLIDGEGVLISGHGRVDAAKRAGLTKVPTIALDHLSPEQARVFRLADNKLATLAEWDDDLLRQELEQLRDAGVDLGLTGFGDQELADLFAIATDAKTVSLSERFLVPPFSVLDARQAYWQARKREWLDLGIASELGRGENMLGFSDLCKLKPTANRGRLLYAQGARTEGLDPTTQRILEAGSGTSVFDPVLCEIAYRWFCPPDGVVLDPFAGGSVRGIVASRLGRKYVGVELRPEQIAANRLQGDAICRESDPKPLWIEGDSQNIKSLVPAGTRADLIIGCPPYADLEVYSDDPRDISSMDYDEFLVAYRKIIAETCALLNDDRFVFWVVGDVRAPDGSYRGFVRDTIDAFEDAGLKLHNDAILVTAIGSLAIRVGSQFAKSRKLGKTHQNVLKFFKGTVEGFKRDFELRTAHANVMVFAKGSARTATAAIGEVEVGDIDDATPETEE